MPTAPHESKITVVDSTRPGGPLHHSMYSIVYVPSWLRYREKFNWSNIPFTTSMMKEYFVSAPILERPIRAQRCLYSMKAIHIYRVDRYPHDSRTLFVELYKNILDYLKDNPVTAWDWAVSWTECRALAKSYPDELTRVFRKWRSHRDLKHTPKPELSYFLELLQEVAKEFKIDMEYKWL